MFTKFLTQCTLSRTLNITTFAHLCTRSQPFYMWVLFYPTGMAAGGCMCLSACFLFVCRWGEGGWGLGTGEINQCLAGKQPPFYPPRIHSSPPPPPVFMPLIHLLCDDAPPAVAGYAASQQNTRMGDIIEKKLHIYAVK